ncbi:hypothetical protein GCM10010129_01020 [Streptomyces fumigatiscleroticus]|nr:hypothetical protein GCM10010129_01020 [Streptomyces fumigatiscleroticus]
MFRHSPRTRRVRLTRLRLAGANAALLLVLAACGTASTGRAGPEGAEGHRPRPPVTTSAGDWTGVARALGRTGTLSEGSVYRVPLLRDDLTVFTHGVRIEPELALGGTASFAKYHDGTMLMGDLVVTERELPKVTDALQAAGIDQTALHKHLPAQHPDIWWTHIHAMGDPVTLAKGVRAALAATHTPPASPPPASPPPVDLDTSGIDTALGRKGTADGGVYRFVLPRSRPVTDGHHVLPSTLGITNAVSFQPLGDGKAALSGDLVTTAAETQKVIRALRKGGIDIVELHNHTQDEHPRLFFLHFWATGDGVGLARSLRPALDSTALAPAT